MALRRTSIRSSHSVPGFTLIEILVVMGILVIVAGFGLFVSMDSFRGYSFHSERDSLISILQKARSQAVNNMCFGASACTSGKAHGVHIAVQGGVLTYTVFQGNTYNAADTLNEVIPARYAAVAVGVGGFTDITFSPLAATTTPTPITARTLHLYDSAGKDSSDISINAEGQILWTN